jgi:hypothetical protein
MLAEDEAGSRFSRAKEAIDAALASLARRRRTVAFAGASEEVAPPTPTTRRSARSWRVDPRRTLDPGSLAAPASRRASSN